MQPGPKLVELLELNSKDVDIACEMGQHMSEKVIGQSERGADL